MLLAATLLAPTAHAVAWPDVAERLEHDLTGADPAIRALAIERVDAVGRGRARPLILRALGDADTGVRVAAAAAAVRERVEGATAAVVPWLAEHDARLRLAACAVARALPDPHAVGPLARALSDADAAVRTSAIEALGAQTSTEAVAPLLGRLDDSSPGVRVEVARALARLGDRRAVVPLIGKVEDSVAEVRLAVARALGDLGDPRAVAALVLQLRDASPDVRVTALGALARTHGADAVDAISPLVADRNADVKRAALGALGSLAHGGSREALQVLVGRLGVDDDANGGLDRTPLRDALVSVGAAAAAPLRGVLHGGAPPAASASAAWVLGELAAKTAAPEILDALRSGRLSAPAALHALRAAGRPEDLPAVLEFVADESPTTRDEAIAATRALLDPAHPDGRAVDPLIAVTRASVLTPAEQRKVIELLGRTGARRAGELLVGFLHSRDLPTRLSAIDALAALGPAGADAPLLDLIGDRAPEVRLHAAEALAATGGATSRDDLLAKLTGGTELDRAASLLALGGVLVRAPSDGAWKQLAGALTFAAGGERDAILVALGRAAPAHPVLDGLARSEDPDDRRVLAAACAGRADAEPLLRALLLDVDPGVRAEAAWSLGSVGGPDALTLLERLAGAIESDVAGNATAAVARIAARLHDAGAATSLCSYLADRRASVRANAAAGLALGGARCADGAAERQLLADPSDAVRLAAARALYRTPRTDDDRSALVRCAASDRSGDVAWACEHAPPDVSAPPRATLAYVETLPRSDPRPRAGYLVQLGDGLLRAGTADRRGAFFDPVAPAGELRLLAPETRAP